MKNSLILFILLVTPIGLSAQLFLNFSATETTPCPNDPSVEVTQPINWEIYQTIDDKWDSPIDSNLCFDFDDMGNSVRLMLDDNGVDPDRPLFARALFSPVFYWEQQPFNLLPDVSSLVGPPTLDVSTGCANSLCSGTLLGFQVLDENGVDSIMQFYPIPGSQIDEELNFFSCFATSKGGGLLKEIIIKFTFDEPNLENRFIDFNGFSFHHADGWFNSAPQEITAFESHFNGSEYDVFAKDFPFGSQGGGVFFRTNFLFEYPYTTFPSSQNLGYINVLLEPNSTEQQVINIIADESNSITFEPFTTLRGGFVLDDTIHHEVNLVNSDNDICFWQVIDLVFEDNFNFLYHSGHIDFNHPDACFMFREGGKLKVGDGATFHYGQNGFGILAMYPDGGIELGENASLVIDNRFFLSGYPERPDMETHMELRPGQSLVFGENAKLARTPWAYAPVHLNVHMLGGILDDSKLSAEERQLIRRIYPPVAENFADNVRLFPNPSPGAFSLEINLPQAEKTVAEVMDLNGRVVFRKEEYFPQGIHVWELDGALGGGVYFVKISSAGNSVVEKMLVY